MKKITAPILIASMSLLIGSWALAEGQSVRQQSQQQQAMGDVHRFMVDAYLKSSEEFLDGFERQVKQTNISTSDSEARDYLATYLRESINSLKGAQTHAQHISQTFDRIPATEQKKKAKAVELRRQIDDSLQSAMELQKNLDSWTSSDNRDQLKQQVSQLKSRINKAMDTQDDLS